MLSLALSLTRLWTRFYTLGLPVAIREARRAEIESDLWEQSGQATAQLSTAAHIAARTILGVPADIVWRAETAAAVRSGKDPDMKGKPWTLRRILALVLALTLLPIPPAWINAATSVMKPGVREESTFSAITLSLGANACILPIGLGVLTIAWNGPNTSFADVGTGSAEVVAGLAAFFGLYVARINPAFGVTLIAGATVAMGLLATWALITVVILGVALTVMALARWFAPAPMRALAT